MPLLERAKIARRAENEFVGAPTGLMDQAASTLSTAGHALFFDCRSHADEPVALDLPAAGLELLVLDTRTPHALVDSEYATRRASCEDAARLLGVAALRDVDDLETALAQLPDEVMHRRVRHVVTENARVLAAADLLRAGRVADLAPLLDASHASMRDDFEITVPTVDLAVETARASGALGARMTGGGFGGCIIALVAAGTADRGGGRDRRALRGGRVRPARALRRGALGWGRSGALSRKIAFRSGSEPLEVTVAAGLRARICQKSSGLAGGDSVNIRKKMGLVTVSVGALLLSACGSDSLGGEPAGSRRRRCR